MKPEHDVGRRIRDWMRDEEPPAADHVVDAVASQLPSVRQRDARRWSLRTFALPLAATAVAVVGLIVVGTWLGQGGGFGFGPAATQPESSEESPLQLVPGDNELEPGTYTLTEDFPVRLTFDVPAGYVGCSAAPTEQGLCPEQANYGITFVIVENLVADPCDISQRPLDPALGPTVNDLVAGLERLPGFAATREVPGELDGLPAQRLNLIAPTRPEECVTSNVLTWVVSSARTNGVRYGERNELWILEVQGSRLMIALAYQPGAPPDVLEEMRDIVESVHFDP